MKKKIAVFLLILIVGLLGFVCLRKTISFNKPIPVDGTFSVGRSNAEFLRKCKNAAVYSQKAKGLALLVIKGEKILFEDYHNGHGPDKPQHLYSGTKSFTGLMYCAAKADGLLDLDDKVSDILPELPLFSPENPPTIKHLLTLTSGYPSAFLRMTWDGLRERQFVKDKYALALRQKPTWLPGKRYRYGCSHFMLLGEIIKRKTKRNPLEYLQEKVFTPIGFRYAGWIRDPRGNPMLSYGCWTTAREWAKFGMLVRDDGSFKGKRVIPAGLIKQCLSGTEAMPAYGLTFWLNKQVPTDKQVDLIPQLKEPAKRGAVLYPQGPDDLVAAAGHNGNRCYVLPSEDMVIVRLGTSARAFRDEKLLSILLGK